MTGPVQTRKNGDVALVTLAGPAGNALTGDMREALRSALKLAIEDDTARAIVIQGAGSGFSAGVDLSEYDGPLAKPHLRDLCTLIEDAPKPVICALHGAVIGGGVELALAAHARVARQGTRLSIPDIRLSLMPGAGATQRLPRLLGAQRAAEFLLSGQSILAEDPRLRRLFVRITPGAPQEAAIALARTHANAGRWSRTCEERRGFSDPGGYARAIAALRAQLPAGEGAAQDILRAIEAAPLFPFAQGLAFEATLFEDRLRAPDCRAARHALRCERQASLTASGLTPEALTRIAIIGAGPAECRIAALLLMTRAAVTLHLPDGHAGAAARDGVANHLPADLTAPERAAIRDRLGLDTMPGALAEADLVLDGGRGALALPPALAPGVIWVGLVPGLTPDRAAGRVARGRFMTLCLHPPVARGGVAEISCAGQSDPQALANLQALFAGLDIRLIRTALVAGALGYRMKMSLRSAANLLTALGADPYAVDAAARSLGFATGPFRDMDAQGLDAALPQLAHFAQARSLVDVSQGLLQALCDKGRMGQKSGRGIYIHGKDGPVPDSALPALLRELGPGQAAAEMDEEALATALLGALVNEAARLQGEGAVSRPGDLDLLALRAMGFARRAGGPLLQADMRGIFEIYKAMRGLSGLSNLWVPHGRIGTMVKNGQGFFGRSAAGG